MVAIHNWEKRKDYVDTLLILGSRLLDITTTTSDLVYVKHLNPFHMIKTDVIIILAYLDPTKSTLAPKPSSIQLWMHTNQQHWNMKPKNSNPFHKSTHKFSQSTNPHPNCYHYLNYLCTRITQHITQTPNFWHPLPI